MNKVGFLLTVLLMNPVLLPYAFAACVGDGDGNFICGAPPGSETSPPLSGVSLVQTGPGETVLTGSNNFSSSSSNAASIVITGGILFIEEPNSLSGDFKLDLNGGVFKTAGEFSFDNSVAFNGGTVNVSGEESVLSLTGELDGTGVSKEGLGLLELKGPSVYNGVLNVNEGGVESISSVLAGAVHINHTDAFVAFAEESGGAFNGTIDGAGTFIKEGEGVLAVGGVISANTDIDGGGISVGSSGALTGDVTLNKGFLLVTQDVTLRQTVSFGTENGGVNVAAGKTLTLAGTLVTKGCEGGNCSELIKDGAGTLIVAADATGGYFGDTRIKQGVLQTGSGHLLGAAGYSVKIEEGTLSVTDTTAITNKIELLSVQSALETAAGKLVTLTAGTAGTGTLHKTGGGTLALAQGFLHTGGTVVEAGVLQSEGKNLRGDIRIESGASLDVVQEADGALSAVLSGSGTVNKKGGGTLALESAAGSFAGGFNVLEGGVKGSSQAFSSDINLAGADTAVIFEQDCSGADCEFSKTVSGEGRLVKTGDGLLVLTGENTYSGGTYVQSQARAGQGILFSSDGALGAAEGGVFLSRGNITLDQNKTVSTERNFTFSELENSITVLDGSVYTLNGTLGGTSFTKLGGGELVLTGSNMHAGGTQITEGVLSAAAAGAVGSGILSVTGGVFKPLSDMTLGNNVYLSAPAGQGGFLVEDGVTLTLNGIVSGGGALTKQGGGTLELGFYNSYLSGVYVQGGRVLGDSGSILGDVTVLPGAEVEFKQHVDGFYTGDIASEGTVVKTGQGALYASARDGAGVLNAGSLRVNEGAFVAQSSLNGDINVAQNAALYLARGGEGSFETAGSLYFSQESEAEVKGDIVVKTGGALGFFVQEGGRYTTHVTDTDVPSGKGNVTIEDGGKITVLASGVFKDPATFDLLTYAGNLNLAGSLADVDVSVANNRRLSARLENGGNVLSLVIMRLLSDYAGMRGLNYNQRQTALALDRASAAPSGDLENVLNAVDALTPAARAQALTRLGGFIYANLPGSFGRFKDNAYLRVNRAPAEEPYFSRNVWVQSVNHYADVKANTYSEAIYQFSSGFVVGADEYFENAGVTAGLFAGYVRHDVKHDGTENLDGDEYRLGAYALKQGELFDFKGALAAGYQADTVERGLAFIGRRARARVKRYGLDADAQIGVKAYESGLVSVRPFVGLEGNYTRTDAFGETGADGVNISFGGGGVFQAYGSAGAGVEKRGKDFSWYADAGVKRRLNGPEYEFLLAGETYRLKPAASSALMTLNAGAAKRISAAWSAYGNMGAEWNGTAQNYFLNIGLRSYW